MFVERNWWCFAGGEEYCEDYLDLLPGLENVVLLVDQRDLITDATEEHVRRHLEEVKIGDMLPLKARICR